MEWPELLSSCAESLRQHELWLSSGCVGPAPAAVQLPDGQGPVPEELRGRVAELATRNAIVERLIADRLASLRERTGHPAPVRGGYDARPVPRYLDALG